jgi:hypothetical protein
MFLTGRKHNARTRTESHITWQLQTQRDCSRSRSGGAMVCIVAWCMRKMGSTFAPIKRAIVAIKGGNE